MIIDAQSVKNKDPAVLMGYDASKKVSGIKRNIAVDTQGLPHSVAVTTAEVTNRKALERCKFSLGRIQSLLADRGYVCSPSNRGRRTYMAGM